MSHKVDLPGPRIPGALQTWRVFLRPVEFLESARRRYGPCFRLDIPPFGEVAYVADPEVIKQVFTGGPETYHAGEGNWIMGPILGEHSVLMLDEDEHMKQRRLVLPPFHGEAVARYADVVRDATAAEVERWPVGKPFSARPSMQRITLEVIMRAVIGVRDEARLAALRRLLPRLTDIKARDLFVATVWPWFLRTRVARMLGPLRTRDKVDAILYDEIRRRRADEERRDDVLSLLIAARDEDGRGLSDAELRDQLITLLLAGHETTATGLAWALERLVRHPEALARLREDVDAGGDEYLDAVCKETLRVRPVIMDVVRKLTEPIEVDGHRVEEGVFVMPSIVLSHLAGETYEEPHAFRPERFLGVKPGTYTWLPFGGGPRRCVGAAFALMEMKTVLRTIVSRVELEPSHNPPERPRVKHVTLVPSKGARVTVAAKRPAKSTVEPAPIAV